MAVPQPVSRVLRASVARHELGLSFARAAAALPVERGDDLVVAAVRHGIAGYVRDAALHSAPAIVALRELRQAVEQAAMRHLRTLADLDHVARALDGVTPWLVVKGPVLAETVHARPEFRSYADLDVLVPPARLGEALQALEASGAQTLDRNWTLIGREMKGEVHVRLPLGTVADLHWSLLNDRPVRERYAVPTGPLFERSRVVEVGGRRVPTLDEADTIVYLALHTLLSGGHRLLWLKDLERVLAQARVSPATVAERAQAWGASVALSAAIARTRLAIGCPPLGRALARGGLADRVWLGFSSLVWRRVPAEREDGSGSLGRMVARSVRPGGAASAAALASKLCAHAFGGSRDGVRGPGVAGGRLNPSSPASDRFDSGGPPARRAYLEAVRRQGGEPNRYHPSGDVKEGGLADG